MENKYVAFETKSKGSKTFGLGVSVSVILGVGMFIRLSGKQEKECNEVPKKIKQNLSSTTWKCSLYVTWYLRRLPLSPRVL